MGFGLKRLGARFAVGLLVFPLFAGCMTGVKTKMKIDGRGYTVRKDGDYARVDQDTLITRGTLDVINRAKRALAQAYPNCTVREEHWNSVALEARLDCPNPSQ